jgi:hypothetical protein
MKKIHLIGLFVTVLASAYGQCEYRVRFQIENCLINAFENVYREQKYSLQKTKLCFILRTTRENYNLQLVELTSPSNLDSLSRGSNRFITILQHDIPLIFDYDLVFSTIIGNSTGHPDDDEDDRIVKIYLIRGSSVEFSKKNHCKFVYVINP